MKQISKLVSELNHLNVQFCEFIDCNKAEASTLCPHHCLKGKKFKKIVTYLPGDYIRYSIQNSIYISELVSSEFEIAKRWRYFIPRDPGLLGVCP